MQNLLIFLQCAIGIAHIRYHAYTCTSYFQYMYHQVSHRNGSIGHRCVYHSNIRIYSNIVCEYSTFVDIPSLMVQRSSIIIRTIPFAFLFYFIQLTIFQSCPFRSTPSCLSTRSMGSSSVLPMNITLHSDRVQTLDLFEHW